MQVMVTFLQLSLLELQAADKEDTGEEHSHTAVINTAILQ